MWKTHWYFHIYETYLLVQKCQTSQMNVYVSAFTRGHLPSGNNIASKHCDVLFLSCNKGDRNKINYFRRIQFLEISFWLFEIPDKRTCLFNFYHFKDYTGKDKMGTTSNCELCLKLKLPTYNKHASKTIDLKKEKKCKY